MERLTWYDRACAIAHYRIHLAIEAHVNQAAEQYTKSQAERDRARSRR